MTEREMFCPVCHEPTLFWCCGNSTHWADDGTPLMQFQCSKCGHTMELR